MATVAASFTGTTTGGFLFTRDRESFTYSVSGTFVGTVLLERSMDGGANFEAVTSFAATVAATTVSVQTPVRQPALYRFRCTAYTSGTIVTSLADSALPIREFRDPNGNLVLGINEDSVGICVRTAQVRVMSAAGLSKVGATAGFVVAAAADTSLVTCPASKTAATLVIPVTHVKVGDTLTAFNLIGAIASSGAAVTVDADLRVQTAAASGVTDGDVASMTQVAASANTLLSSANGKSGLSRVVAVGESYYLLVTVTTAASTSVTLQGVALTVTEA